MTRGNVLPAARSVRGVVNCHMSISAMSGLDRTQSNPALLPSVQHLARKKKMRRVAEYKGTAH